MGIPKMTGVLSEACVQIVVEKEKSILDAMKKGPRPSFARIGGQPPGRRRQCWRQVYADKEVAENTARMLAKHGIAATEIQRCPICGMLHLIEMRST